MHTYPLRLVPPLLGGFTASVCLVWLMAFLIRTDGVSLEAPEPIVIQRWIVRDEPPPEVVDRKPPEPIPLEPEPSAPPPLLADDVATGMGVAYQPPDVGTQVVTPGRAGDGELLPLVKVRPVYPRKAASREIEGYVVIAFTVSATGAVVDPVVIESVPRGIFDRAALSAIVRFKYRPRVVDGLAVPVYDQYHRISFELADG